MGSDCCGGPAPGSAPAENGSAQQAPQQQKSAKASAAANAKPHKDYAVAKQPYYKKRVDIFEQYYQREQEKVEKAKADNKEIKVTLPDGGVREGVAGVTTPLDIANAISTSLGKKVLVAKVTPTEPADADSKTWDIQRPLVEDCCLRLCTFEDAEGKDTFWHSSSHILGEALESQFGVDLTIGPAIEEGFYYDCFLEDGRTLGEADKPTIEKRIQELVKLNARFQRVVITRNEALAMFQENRFKVEIISGLPQDAVISLYRCGPMVDLCTGPHLPSTGFLKAQAVSNLSRAFWRADAKKDPLQHVYGINDLNKKALRDYEIAASLRGNLSCPHALQRVYGITFPDKKALKEYQTRMEEAKKRDHRLLGTQHDLFMMHPLSPGSCFFMPHGARIYNQLMDYIREKYWEYEYEEVVSPNMYNFDLWKTSGHAAHYKENMFCIDVEKQEFGLKPMNCPGHCLMFANRARSYRELPLRFADFGVLHRNEYSGALQGLTRVRRFQQDDAHVFCRPDQIKVELKTCLRMLDEVYTTFGLSYKMALSTRPDKRLGDEALWDSAEGALTEAMNETGLEWELNPADGAFYGPKIDITVFDALRRKFQCATIQLDFQLPIRFDLSYQTEGQKYEQPVMIHRAILGSVERMFAILTEHFAAKWPFWLNPRQVMIVPVTGTFSSYAEKVKAHLRQKRLFVDVDVSDRKMEKKVREAQLAQYNYILVVGKKEEDEKTVNVRTRDNKVHGMVSWDKLSKVLLEEKSKRSLTSCFGKDHVNNAEPKQAQEAAQKGADAAQSQFDRLRVN